MMIKNDGMGGAAWVQREAKDLLYARLILRRGPATVEDVARELGVCHSSVTRQCTGDIPVQARTPFALQPHDPEGCQVLVELLAGAAGYELRPIVHELPSRQSALSAVASTGAASSESSALACAALRDGHVTGRELDELAQQWREEDRAREQMRAKLRTMAANTERQAGRRIPITRAGA